MLYNTLACYNSVHIMQVIIMHFVQLYAVYFVIEKVGGV